MELFTFAGGIHVKEHHRMGPVLFRKNNEGVHRTIAGLNVNVLFDHGFPSKDRFVITVADLLGLTMQNANLVTCRVAQISQIQNAKGAISRARWVFTSGATVGNACRMKCMHLL